MEKSMEGKKKMKRPVWDCESSLYDSFELKSFERQLDSAITNSGRSLSMPHLTHATNQPQPQPHSHQTLLPSKKNSKISRSFYNLIRSLFKTNKQNTTTNHGENMSSSGRLFGVYDDRRRNGQVLTTIPEFDIRLSPEMRSALLTRTSSGRFSPTSIIAISCI